MNDRNEGETENKKQCECTSLSSVSLSSKSMIMKNKGNQIFIKKTERFETIIIGEKMKKVFF